MNIIQILLSSNFISFFSLPSLNELLNFCFKKKKDILTLFYFLNDLILNIDFYFFFLIEKEKFLIYKEYLFDINLS